jgi:hypothetical protein
MTGQRVLRLPELIEMVTRPEVIEQMIAELGVERTREALMVLKAKAEAWARDADEMDPTDLRRG